MSVCDQISSRFVRVLNENQPLKCSTMKSFIALHTAETRLPGGINNRDDNGNVAEQEADLLDVRLCHRAWRSTRYVDCSTQRCALQSRAVRGFSLIRPRPACICVTKRRE